MDDATKVRQGALLPRASALRTFIVTPCCCGEACPPCSNLGLEASCWRDSDVTHFNRCLAPGRQQHRTQRDHLGVGRCAGGDARAVEHVRSSARRCWPSSCTLADLLCLARCVARRHKHAQAVLGPRAKKAVGAKKQKREMLKGMNKKH
jgi:hypothetical protein